MKKIPLCLLFYIAVFSVSAQGTYQIGNETVSDCSGIFISDQQGIPPGNYTNNEDFIFHICIPGVDSIILTFTSFCTEEGFDSLTLYDGPDTTSPIIGVPYSGLSIPPVTIARSGCLTARFVSDASVTCTGWQAYWTVSKTVPKPPVISPIPNQACNVNSLILTLNDSVLCDSVSAGNIQILGPTAQTVVSAIPLNCTGGKTTSIQVQTSPGFTSNGNYNLILNTSYLDACDSLWLLTSYQNFSVSGCPLTVQIHAHDTAVCLGACTKLKAIGSGSIGTYSYNWSNGLGTGAGPIKVCPVTTTTYSVTVSDNIGTPPGTASYTVKVVPPAQMPPNDTVCQTTPEVFFSATPSGGYWSGWGIADANNGGFMPGWVGSGLLWLYYNYDGCVDSFTTYIIPMSAGLPVAACPNSAPFNLQGNPVGGTWSGTGITNSAMGTFSPLVSDTGSFTVTYSDNVCPPATTVVNVEPINVQAGDTLCQNSGSFNLAFSPLGGVWSGPGIVNWFWGTFDPANANAGTDTLVYSMYGCSDTIYITVKPIWAGWDISACPTQAPFALTPGIPPGGYWTGPGIDSATGFFNPGYLSGGQANTYGVYNVSGCRDSIIIYDNITTILYDTIGLFCPYDNPIELDWGTTENYPGGGIWTGSGVVSADTFAPGMAQTGWNKLYYSVNGCTDSTNVQVYFDPKLSDTVTCNVQSPFQIKQLPPGGNWAGTGIVNPDNGTFSPQVSGIGTFTITYTSPDNCVFTFNITVDTIPALSFTGLPTSICFKDTNFALQPNYPDGVWSGVPSTGIFNPTATGSGLYTIFYTMGSGQCLASASASVFISDSLLVSTPFGDTTICQNGLVRLYANGTGGNNLNYNFSWSDNLGNGTSYLVGPNTTTTYYVILNDGCSRADTTAILVNVQSPFTIALTTGAIECYGAPSSVIAQVSPPGNYMFNWGNDSTGNTPQISALSGYYYGVTVTDPASGCFVTADTTAPTYGQIVADFLTTPAGECVSTLSPEVDIINQSVGATDGYWNYGDGQIKDYNDSTSLIHDYENVGKYTITLVVQNAGGCSDSTTRQVCVTQSTRLIAPTAFSPNGDGVNDLYLVKVLGVSDFTLAIFNRWGQEVFATNNPNDPWDGTYKNAPCPIGVYVYTITYKNLESDEFETVSGNITLLR